MHKSATNNFKLLYWYGERYYCGMDVDAAIRSTDQENAELKTTLQECRAHLQTIHGISESSEYWNANATATASAGTYNLVCPVPVCIEPETDLVSSHLSPLKPPVSETDPLSFACLDSPRSVISGSGSLSYDGGSCDGSGVTRGARGRAVGKRNQEIYLPDGVRISHIAEKYDSEAREMVQYEWVGRYDQSANVIAASQASQSSQAQQPTYETLKHFAQEHDRETYGENYTPDFTANVWKNPMFKFYNTVARAWEPLSSLRAT